MKSYFFNAEPTEDLERYPTGYDRAYDADDHAAFFEPLLGSAGVLLGEGDEEPCKVTAQGHILHINAGAAYIKGRMAVFDGTETLPAQSGHVVVRLNKSVEVRAFQLLIVAQPVQGEGDLYDLPLAQVTVSGESVGVIDERSYVTARVLGGHRHRAEELDGVSKPGHTHGAREITSGVLEEARVPYVPEFERMTGRQTILDYQEASLVFPAGGRMANYAWHIPYATPRSKRPKRLIVTFCGTNNHNTSLDPSAASGGNLCFVDMAYGRDGVIRGEAGGIDTSTALGQQFAIYPVDNFGSFEVFDCVGYFYTERTAYRNTGGFGWSGFLQRGGKDAPENADFNSRFAFGVGKFSFDANGVDFVFSTGYTTQQAITLNLKFCASFYFFD